MPRAFSSGAASIWSYALASPPNSLDSTVVIAAVSVVLPWSTWPIVPTFMCGLVRSNFAFAIAGSFPSLPGCLDADRLLGEAGGDVAGDFFVVVELHAVARASLRERAQVRRV